MKAFNFIYRTVNKITGDYYIGKHSTDILDDGYLGSGLLLSRAFRKYGKENFERQILEFVTEEKELNTLEKEFLTEEVLRDSRCYNIAKGGQGGNLGEEINISRGKTMSKILSGRPKTKDHKAAISNSWKNKVSSGYAKTIEQKEQARTNATAFWETLTPEQRKAICGHSGKDNGFYGKTHTETSIMKMKENLPNREGKNNPRAKSITLYGIHYSCYSDAISSLGLNKRSFYKLLKEIGVK